MIIMIIMIIINYIVYNHWIKEGVFFRISKNKKVSFLNPI